MNSLNEFKFQKQYEKNDLTYCLTIQHDFFIEEGNKEIERHSKFLSVIQRCHRFCNVLKKNSKGDEDKTL